MLRQNASQGKHGGSAAADLLLAEKPEEILSNL